MRVLIYAPMGATEQEYDEWVDRYKAMGYTVSSCYGREVGDFLRSVNMIVFITETPRTQEYVLLRERCMRNAIIVREYKGEMFRWYNKK